MWKARPGKPTVTWAQGVREALCFGWIDGQARRIDDESHVQRFTPRKSRRWSAINYRKMAAFYVTSAKLEETRAKRLATLMTDTANGLRLKQMRRR